MGVSESFSSFSSFPLVSSPPLFILIGRVFLGCGFGGDGGGSGG